jgi:hypothetical protein
MAQEKVFPASIETELVTAVFSTGIDEFDVEELFPNCL